MSETVSDVLSQSQRALVNRFAEGDQLALARCITQVEDRTPGFEALLDALHDRVGSAHRIGITGPPGAGKSTLTASIARRLRDRGHRVGVVAVDPSSPFTGGALLGDRIRMDGLATEQDIFIRSMASRGAHGGLAAMTREAVDVMDAFGFDRILIETVGVGQSELEIASSADTTVVVLVPESGDGIQAMKAGLMEVADVFVVNKADRAGADMLRKEIQVARALASVEEADRSGWSVPILKTVAPDEEGVPELVEQIENHREWLLESGTLESSRRSSWMQQVREVLARAAASRADVVWRRWAAEAGANGTAADASPYEIGWRLLADLQSSHEMDEE